MNCREIFKGVDLAFYSEQKVGTQNRLECDLVLRPGVDPKPTGFALTGEASAHLDGEGNLVATVDGEEFKLLKPVGGGGSCSRAAGGRLAHDVRDHSRKPVWRKRSASPLARGV